MSTTMEYRYEISSPGYGVIEHVKKFEEAKTVAHNWIDREGSDVEIFDRLARKNQPELWTVTKCTGEAHHNPFIDNCMVCLPNWEIIVKVKARKGNHAPVLATV